MKRPTFILPNGQRTSITITEFQNFIIKVLARKKGISKSEWLSNTLAEYDTEYKYNRSEFVRDRIICELLENTSYFDEELFETYMERK